jgi:hypothetical protein
MAPEVARIMAAELEYDDQWQTDQVAGYVSLAEEYLLVSICGM